MRLSNCLGRLSECLYEMALSSQSARQKVLNAFVKQFAGLSASDFPPELAPEYKEILAEMKEGLLPLLPGNYHASLGKLSQKDARRLIKRIWNLHHNVVKYDFKLQLNHSRRR